MTESDKEVVRVVAIAAAIIFSLTAVLTFGAWAGVAIGGWLSALWFAAVGAAAAWIYRKVPE